MFNFAPINLKRTAFRRAGGLGALAIACMAQIDRGAAAETAPLAVQCVPIRTAAQLSAMRQNLSGSYCLQNDIDTGSIANFVPVGNFGNPFTGNFFGNNHVIRNLKVNTSSTSGAGLFGSVDGAVIKDVALLDVNIISRWVFNGAIQAFPGGIAGVALGSSQPTTISNVFVSGSVKCPNSLSLCTAGGLVGWIKDNVTVSDSWSAADVSAVGGTNIGGVVGIFGASVISRTAATGSVTCTGSCRAGGLVGQAGTGSKVEMSYATGPVSSGAVTSVGGLIGLQGSGTIAQSYAGGSVVAGDNAEVGGLVGEMQDTSVTESYAVGRVQGGTGATTGGLIGHDLGGNTVASSYWDTSTSAMAVSAGGTGLATAQLRSALPAGFGTRWAITQALSYPFLNDTSFAFTSPLATLVPSNKVFVFLPLNQLDASQYATAPAHANAAAKAAVYTMIARSIGITDAVVQLKNVKIDKYFWSDATQITTWKGPVTAHATLGTLKDIAAGAHLDTSNVINQLNAQHLAILRGTYTPSGGGTATHWMLATLYVNVGANVGAVIAHDPLTGWQVEIDPASKKVVAPANFPLVNFKVNGYQAVTVN